MKLRTKAIVSGLLALGIAGVASVPAQAASVGLPARTCGTAGAPYVYIATNGYNQVNHVHYNTAAGPVTTISFLDPYLTFRSSTAHYRAETGASRIDLGSSGVLRGASNSCDV